MPPPAIVTSELTKHFGEVQALDGLNLEIGPGEIFGFLGPNGAGKTTCIRLLLDFLRPTSGSASILGMDARAEAVAIRRRVGYLPSDLALDRRLTGRQLLDYFGSLRAGVVDPAWRDELVRRMALDPDRRMRDLSTGNRKKVGIIQAFMHRPEVLILDEPTSGLDPLLQRTFLDLVGEAAAEGACVFFSSHVLSEVEDVADRIGILRAGRLVAVDTVAALTRQAVRHLVLRFAEPVPSEPFQRLPGIGEIAVDGALVDATVTGSPDALIKVAARYELIDISPRDTDLEEIFLAYYQEGSR